MSRTRAVTIATASLALLSISAISVAAHAEDPFGKRGDVVVGGTAFVARTAADGGSGPNLSVNLSPRVDVFVADRWFLGVTPFVEYASTWFDQPQADGSVVRLGSSYHAYGGGVRLGRDVPVGDRLALRPVIGASVFELGASSTGAPDVHGARASVSAHLELAYALSDHVFLVASTGSVSATFGKSLAGTGYLGPGASTGVFATLGAIGLGIEGRL